MPVQRLRCGRCHARHAQRPRAAPVASTGAESGSPRLPAASHCQGRDPARGRLQRAGLRFHTVPAARDRGPLRHKPRRGVDHRRVTTRRVRDRVLGRRAMAPTQRSGLRDRAAGRGGGQPRLRGPARPRAAGAAAPRQRRGPGPAGLVRLGAGLRRRPPHGRRCCGRAGGRGGRGAAGVVALGCRRTEARVRGTGRGVAGSARVRVPQRGGRAPQRPGCATGRSPPPACCWCAWACSRSADRRCSSTPWCWERATRGCRSRSWRPGSASTRWWRSPRPA